MDDHFHDECGVFGIFGAEEAANLTYLGLHSLQHRGQESSGIVSSEGQQLFAHRAMGLVQDPTLLIMDEPTQGLSDPEIETFKALVRDVARDATVLLIEHNMSVVMELADRITVLNFGEVLAEGTPDEVRANAEVQAAYLGGSA